MSEQSYDDLISALEENDIKLAMKLFDDQDILVSVVEFFEKTLEIAVKNRNADVTLRLLQMPQAERVFNDKFNKVLLSLAEVQDEKFILDILTSDIVRKNAHKANNNFIARSIHNRNLVAMSELLKIDAVQENVGKLDNYVLLQAVNSDLPLAVERLLTYPGVISNLDALDHMVLTSAITNNNSQIISQLLAIESERKFLRKLVITNPEFVKSIQSPAIMYLIMTKLWPKGPEFIKDELKPYIQEQMPYIQDKLKEAMDIKVQLALQYKEYVQQNTGPTPDLPKDVWAEHVFPMFNTKENRALTMSQCMSDPSKVTMYLLETTIPSELAVLAREAALNVNEMQKHSNPANH